MLKINARDCLVEEVEKEVANEFLEMYHLQGKTNSLVQLGLFINNELI